MHHGWLNFAAYPLGGRRFDASSVTLFREQSPVSPVSKYEFGARGYGQINLVAVVQLSEGQ